MSVSDSGAPYLEENALVVAKRSAMHQRPTSVHLIGYLARDAEPGQWRVYFNERLDSYVRVSESSIVSNLPHPRAEQAEGRTVVKVDAPDDLELVRVVPEQLQASFLQGEFVSRLTPGMSLPTPGAATAGSSAACVLTSILIVVETIEITSAPPPPVPSAAATSDASCCLCWTPEALCPGDVPT
jgi:hypothetical protein